MNALGALIASLLMLPACSSDDAVVVGGQGSNTDSGHGRPDARSGGTGGSTAFEGGGGIGLVPSGTGGSATDAGAAGAAAGGNDAGLRDGDTREDAARDGVAESGSVPVDCSPVSSLPVPDDPCTALATAECARLETCQAFQLRFEFSDQSTCLTLKLRECSAKYGLPGQPAALLAAVHGCASLLMNAPCACTRDEVCPDFRPSPGSLPNSTPCQESTQCAGGLCDRPSGSTCGACTVGGKSGDPCGSFNPPCGAGLVCGTSQACIAPVSRGGFCLDGSECQSGLACVDARCSAPLRAGANCDSNPNACDGPLGLSCIGGTCIALGIASAVGDGGEACGFDQTGGFTACDGDSRCSGGKCMPKDGKGAACDPFSSPTNPTCLPLLVCSPSTNQCTDPGTPSCPVGDAGADGGDR